MNYKQKIRDFIANLMTFANNNKPIFVVALLYICFKSLWENLFKIFIIPIISQFSSNWITTTIFFFFVILIIFKTIQDWLDGKKTSDTLTGLSIFTLSLWGYYRFSSTPAIHTTPYTVFCYVDIILAICIAVIFLRCFPKSFKTLEAYHNGFLTDSPIEKSTEDILNRSIQAKDLVAKMLATDTTKEAFTLGIVAPWGEGKTSFIKLMQNYIPKEYISFTFNPWIYRKKSNLTTLFFDELKNSIKPYSPTLASNIDKYADLLSNVNNEWTQFSAYLLRISNEKTTYEQYQILKDNIKKLSRKIIVFIDDIDRLNSEEIEEILRLVRNGSNLPNMYFVLAYDKNYIIEALSKQFTTHSLSYTKKILQEEYVLPLASKKQKADILMAGLKDLLNNEEELKKLRDGVIGSYVSKINPIDYIHTLRDVKKVTNEFIFNYRNLHGEVNVVDFFIFELFKYHYPLVVDLLIRRKDDILINTGQSMCVYFDGHNALNQTDPTRFYKKEYFNLIDYVKQHHEEFHLSNQDIQQVVCFMESLWGEFKSTEIGSINNPMYIDRYLNCNLLQSEVSEVEFNELLKLPFIEMKTKLSEWMVNKSGSLIYRLQNLYPDKKIEIYKLLHILFYVGCKSGYTHRLFNCINNQIASLLYIEAIIALRVKNSKNNGSILIGTAKPLALFRI